MNKTCQKSNRCINMIISTLCFVSASLVHHVYGQTFEKWIELDSEKWISRDNIIRETISGLGVVNNKYVYWTELFGSIALWDIEKEKLVCVKKENGLINNSLYSDSTKQLYVCFSNKIAIYKLEDNSWKREEYITNYLNEKIHVFDLSIKQNVRIIQSDKKGYNISHCIFFPNSDDFVWTMNEQQSKNSTAKEDITDTGESIMMSQNRYIATVKNLFFTGNTEGKITMYKKK